MIFAQSRYATADLVFATDAAGHPRQVVPFPAPRVGSFSATRHIIREGERLDHLASRYYDDPEMWWVIADANPEIFYPENIPAGTVVRIPSAPSLL